MSKVKSIHDNQYTISDNSTQHLLDLGFKYDHEEEKYVYNFTLMKYEKTVVLRGRITAYIDTKEIQIDVMDNNYTPYPPFYNVECGNYDVILSKINKAILNEFSKLKIVKRKGETNENQHKKTN